MLFLMVGVLSNMDPITSFIKMMVFIRECSIGKASFIVKKLYQTNRNSYALDKNVKCIAILKP